MAESTDKKTRKIAEKRVENGKEFEGYQEAQNQLLAIQAEQQQNLALQANDAANIQTQNQTLGQAAEIMAMDDLNPATQGLLAGYGLNQPKVIKESNIQKQGPNNITINNTTINNTSGPVQGREISIRPQENQGKFKAWLTNVFARQDAEWQKRNQEYNRRESSLNRNANKMMRKIESLGKDIGNAIDPRKIAQRSSNSTMNLLKALGLVLLAKKLPGILKSLSNIEGKIKGWISDIGDKISGVFSGDGVSSLFEKLKNGLWNKDETGILNKLLKSISQSLYKRKELADASIKTFDNGNYETPLDGIKRILSWLSAFFGGQKAAIGLLNKAKEAEIKNGLELKEDAGLGTVMETDAHGRELSNDRINLSNGGLRGSSTVNEDYLRWAEKEGLSAGERKKSKNKENFLRQYNKIYYKGESDILTKRLHELSGAGKGLSVKHTQAPTTLTRHDFSPTGKSLSSESRRATLAASLDLYNILKWKVEWWGVGSQNNIKHSDPNSKEINIDRVFYLLKLLSEDNDILVFTKFLDLFNLTKDDECSKVIIKLIIEDMSEYDRKWYWRKSNEGYSYKYLKIVNSSVSGNPIELDEPDFNNKPAGEKQWEVCKIDSSIIQKIINRLTGENEINYTEGARRKALENLKILGIINGVTEQNSVKLIKRDDNYEEAWGDMKRLEKLDNNETPKSSDVNYSNSAKLSFQTTNYQTLDDNGNLISKTFTKEQKEENAKKVFEALKKEGFTDEQAAGIAGVLRHESAGFNPAAICTKEYKEGKPGFGEGIAQWTDSRKKLFEKWWKSKHPNEEFPGIRNLPFETQLEYLLKEFKERKVYNKIKSLTEESGLSKAEIIKQATDLFTRGFENGDRGGETSIESMEKTYSKNYKNWVSYEENILKPRLNYASGIYNTFVGKLESENIKKSSSPNNPINRTSSSVYRPSGTVGFAPEFDKSLSEVIQPDSIIPSENSSDRTSIGTTSKQLAERISNSSNQTSDNNDQMNSTTQQTLLACANGITYIANSLEILNSNINSGNVMVANAISKSGQPTNLTPNEQPIETNLT